MTRARFFLAVVLLSLGSTVSLHAYVTGTALPKYERIAISDNSAESVYPAENTWLNPESRIGLLCHNDPVNHSDPFGLEFFPGQFEEVDSIPGYFGRTFSSPHITFKLVPTEGGFRPQMKVDVTVHRKEIATHAHGHLRSERAKEATKEHENKHEAQQKQWHDKNQDSGPKGPFPNKESAEKAGNDTKINLRKDFYNNVKENDRHQPDGEWKGILEREKRN